jgi:drug/metabolite transporter (DMT)-like permease
MAVAREKDGHLVRCGAIRHGAGMRLILLTTLTMAAFAGNSVLNRLAVGQDGLNPASFALIRVGAGAATLILLLVLRDGLRLRPRLRLAAGSLPGITGLSIYLAAFSVAYTGLTAGAGALILFGTVQITMFAGAVLSGKALAPLRVAGAGVAFLGLLALLWPGAAASVALGPAFAMALAGVGWGVYSLAGGRNTDALAGTALNFVGALPVIALFWLATGAAPLTGPGVWLAAISGAVTSGLGYALWYHILPALGTQRAAVAQLTVPVLAAAGGAALLGEGLGLRFAVASLLVLGGVGMASLFANASKGVPR